MQGETFIFFGIIGSGKGTQIKLLEQYLKEKTGINSVYVYPGGEYRKHIESNDYLGRLVKDSMTRGELQPDLITTSIVTNIFINSLTDQEHLLLDGYPRSLVQSGDFEALAKFWKRNRAHLIYIEISKDESIKRNMLRARFDDTKEGIEKRFEEYEQNVIPAMHYFEGKPGYTLHKINGEQSIEKVHEDIIKAIGI